MTFFYLRFFFLVIHKIFDRGLIFNMAAVKELFGIFLFHFFPKFYLGKITVVCRTSELSGHYNGSLYSLQNVFGY